jgi:hypothetical protein
LSQLLRAKPLTSIKRDMQLCKLCNLRTKEGACQSLLQFSLRGTARALRGIHLRCARPRFYCPPRPIFLSSLSRVAKSLLQATGRAAAGKESHREGPFMALCFTGPPLMAGTGQACALGLQPGSPDFLPGFSRGPNPQRLKPRAKPRERGSPSNRSHNRQPGVNAGPSQK